VAAWLQKETPISPAQVVDISPSAITAMVTVTPTSKPRGFLATVDSEAVNPDIESHDGVSSWSIPVEVNCDQRSVRLGVMTGFRSRDLRSEPKVLRQADTEFVSPTPTAPLGAVIRALCERDFKRPLVGVPAKLAGKPGSGPTSAKSEPPPGPKPEIVAAAPRPKPEAKKPEATKPEAAKTELAASAPKPEPEAPKSKPEPAAPVVAAARKPEPLPAAPVAAAARKPEPSPAAPVVTAARKPEPSPAAPPPEPTRATPPAVAAAPVAQPQPRPAPKRPIIASIVIQVGASPSLPEAKGILARVKHKFASELDGFKADVATAEVDGKPLNRVLISGFSSTSDARALCAKLQARGQACFVRD
jgi:hypothetical protein